MIEVNEINVVASSANWQIGPTSLQANAEVIGRAVAKFDTIPESAKEQIESFLTDWVLDMQGHYHQVDQYIPDILVEYAPEIFEIVQLLRIFL